MHKQRGIAIRYFAGEAIANAISIVGTGADQQYVGKAVAHGTDDEEVIGATASNSADFAGVIDTVDVEATITRSNSLVNDGARSVAEGDAVGVINDGVVMVKLSTDTDYKEFITTDAAGTFKPVVFSSTATVEESLSICGRAMATGKAGEVIPALIWVRK